LWRFWEVVKFKNKVFKFFIKGDYLHAYINLCNLFKREWSGIDYCYEAISSLLALSNKGVNQNILGLSRRVPEMDVKNFIYKYLSFHGSSGLIELSKAFQDLSLNKLMEEFFVYKKIVANYLRFNRLPGYPANTISAEIYLGEFASVINRISKLPIEKKRNPSLQQYLAYSRLCVGDVPRLVVRDLIENESVSENERMIEISSRKKFLFKNHSIAIIGPCAGHSFANELNNFDGAIVTNALSIDRFFGFSGVKISWYNKPFFRAKKNEILEFCLKYNIIPCLNNLEFLKSLEEMGGGLDILVKSRILKPFLTTNPGMHGIQRIIWDVLKFEPKRLKLFGVSFFMDNYSENYMPDDMSSYIDDGHVGINHDPYQSFIFTKNLFALELIEADDYTGRFLGIEGSDYMEFLINLNKNHKN
jgi:hypothetical protein